MVHKENVRKASDIFKDVPKNLRQQVWDIMEQLPLFLKGDVSATQKMNRRNPHVLTANYSGWTSLDIIPGKRGMAGSLLRFLYKKRTDGSIDYRILDTHTGR